MVDSLLNNIVNYAIKGILINIHVISINNLETSRSITLKQVHSRPSLCRLFTAQLLIFGKQ